MEVKKKKNVKFFLDAFRFAAIKIKKTNMKQQAKNMQSHWFCPDGEHMNLQSGGGLSALQHVWL